MRFGFIRQQMKAYPVRLLCRVMGVSRSGFYSFLHRRRRKCGVNAVEERIKARMRFLFQQSPLQLRLAPSGQEAGSGRLCRRPLQGAPSDAEAGPDGQGSPAISDDYRQPPWLSRGPQSPGTPFCGRGAQPSLDSGHHLCLDAGRLAVSGPWSWTCFHAGSWAGPMDDNMRSQLPLRALAMAYWRRKPAPGLLHHSDRGSQYAGGDYRQHLKQYGMTASMSRKGNCWDNAPTKRFFRSLKSERLTSCRLENYRKAEVEILDYITFYNQYRLHSTLDYRSPQDFEKQKIN